MASTFTIQLPAGTNVTKLINIPPAGSWLGSVVVSWCTHTSSMTVHKAIFITEGVPGNPNIKGYRHVNYDGVGPTFDEWVLPAEARIWRLMFATESMFKLQYTSTYDVSVLIETKQDRTEVRPYPSYSVTPPTLYKYDGRLEWVNK